MKEFLLLFRNVGGNGQYITTPQDMQEDMPKWQQWIGNIAGQGKLIATHPIDYNGIIVDNNGQRPGPYMEVKQLVAGYLLCKAENDAEVLEWANTCPILKYPEGSVEIRPITPFEV